MKQFLNYILICITNYFGLLYRVLYPTLHSSNFKCKMLHFQISLVSVIDVKMGALPVWAFLLIVGVVLAVIVWVTSENGMKPKYHAVRIDLS